MHAESGSQTTSLSMGMRLRHSTWISSVFVDDNEISDVVYSAGVDQLRHDVVSTVEPLGVWKHQTKLLQCGEKEISKSVLVESYTIMFITTGSSL